MDQFVEHYLGIHRDIRIRLTSVKVAQSKPIETVLHRVETFLQSLHLTFDLSNIRDDILGDIHQFMYLNELR
jgi:hypothetical protein